MLSTGISPSRFNFNVIRVCLMVLCMMLIVGCSDKYRGKEDSSAPTPAPVPGGIQEPLQAEELELEGTAESANTLTLWSYYEGADWVIPVVKEAYPDIEIIIEEINMEGIVPLFLSAIDQGESPDLIMLDQSMLGELNSLDVFENLSQPPYLVEDMMYTYPAEVLSSFRTLTEKSLFALPLEINPVALFYRHDLVEEAGFPAEPEELAVFLKSTDNWLDMAKTFKDEGKAMVNWEIDPLIMAEYTTSFFDEQFQFTRSSPLFMEMMELSQEIIKLDLNFGADVESEYGFEMLEQDNTVMFYKPWWYYYELPDLLPDQAGKWRITRLPFNMYGSYNHSTISISSASKNKEAAWLVTELLARDAMGIVQDRQLKASNPKLDTGDPYYGGQKVDVLFNQLMNQIPSYTYTPLDKEAKLVWDQAIQKGIVEMSNAEKWVRDTSGDLTDALRQEIEIMKSSRVLAR